MTKRQLSVFLNKEFKKWNAEEDFSYGDISVKVVGPISTNTAAILNNMLPAGTRVTFQTMGFFERLFSVNGRWKINF